MSNRLAVLAADIRQAHEDVGRASKQSAERAVDAGRWLAEAKDDESIPRGGWARWAEEEAGVPYSTAQRYIQLYNAVSEQSLTVEDVAEAGQKGALKEVARKILEAQNEALTEELKRENPLPIVQGKYGTIVIDPPWEMQKIAREVRPNQVGFDYPTMTEEELAAFPVADMAADDCHLFCWTTHKFLPVGFRLLERWGFRYVNLMVWHKPGGFQPIGLQQYNCEFILYGRKGSPEFTETKNFPCAFYAERREHSRKPDALYAMIRRVTEDGRIDVFSREKREGFDQFGNEIAKFGDAA
jgi:N6-adenosine-specific RNA methylase IME4